MYILYTAFKFKYIAHYIPSHLKKNNVNVKQIWSSFTHLVTEDIYCVCSSSRRGAEGGEMCKGPSFTQFAHHEILSHTQFLRSVSRARLPGTQRGCGPPRWPGTFLYFLALCFVTFTLSLYLIFYESYNFFFGNGHWDFLCIHVSQT